jgi:hypothetical protein
MKCQQQAKIRLKNAFEQELEAIREGQRNYWWHILATTKLENFIYVFFGQEVLEELCNSFLQKPGHILIWMIANGGTKLKDGSVIFRGVKVRRGRVGLVITEGDYEYADEESACLTTRHRIAYRKVGDVDWLPL